MGTHLWSHYKYVCFTPFVECDGGPDVVPIGHRCSGRGRFQPIQIVLGSDSGALAKLRGREVFSARDSGAAWALRFPHFSAGTCGSPEAKSTEIKTVSKNSCTLCLIGILHMRRYDRLSLKMKALRNSRLDFCPPIYPRE